MDHYIQSTLSNIKTSSFLSKNDISISKALSCKYSCLQPTINTQTKQSLEYIDVEYWKQVHEQKQPLCQICLSYRTGYFYKQIIYQTYIQTTKLSQDIFPFNCNAAANFNNDYRAFLNTNGGYIIFGIQQVSQQQQQNKFYEVKGVQLSKQKKKQFIQTIREIQKDLFKYKNKKLQSKIQFHKIRKSPYSNLIYQERKNLKLVDFTAFTLQNCPQYKDFYIIKISVPKGVTGQAYTFKEGQTKIVQSLYVSSYVPYTIYNQLHEGVYIEHQSINQIQDKTKQIKINNPQQLPQNQITSKLPEGITNLTFYQRFVNIAKNQKKQLDKEKKKQISILLKKDKQSINNQLKKLQDQFYELYKNSQNINKQIDRQRLIQISNLPKYYIVQNSSLQTIYKYMQGVQNIKIQSMKNCFNNQIIIILTLQINVIAERIKNCVNIIQNSSKIKFIPLSKTFYLNRQQVFDRLKLKLDKTNINSNKILNKYLKFANFDSINESASFILYLNRKLLHQYITIVPTAV